MTDHHNPLDDLVSAHLDGETTSTEAAQIASDPALGERLAELAAVRDALRSSATPVDATRREQAVAAALVAYDEDGGDRAIAPVTALAPPPRARRNLRLVGIAAAVALLALAVPLLGRLDSGSNDDLATGTLPSTTESAVSPAQGGADALAAPETMGAAGDSPDLGAYASLPELTQAVRDTLTSEARNSYTAADNANGSSAKTARWCDAGDDDTGTVVFQGLAVLDGRPVVVTVREDPDGGHTLVALDRDDCTEVAGGKL